MNNTLTELEHRDGAVAVLGCELLGSGHVDYGGPRSFQVKIYRGFSVKSRNRIYIVQKLGLSSVPGERTRANCTIVRKLAAVVQVLHSLRRDKTGLYMPRAAVLALEEAAEIVPALGDIWEEYKEE